jgi:hypothetical protein
MLSNSSVHTSFCAPCGLPSCFQLGYQAGLSSSTRENVNFCSWNLEILEKNLKDIGLPEGIFRIIGTSFVIVHNKWQMEDLM